MKKFIIILFTFLFISLGINTDIILAQPPSKTLSQGVYHVKDTLLINVSYNAQNTSYTNKCVIEVLDSNLSLKEYIILESRELHYKLKPLQYGDTVVIVGNVDIDFS